MTGQCKTCGEATTKCYFSDGWIGICKCEVVILEGFVESDENVDREIRRIAKKERIRRLESADRLMRKETK